MKAASASIRRKQDINPTKKQQLVTITSTSPSTLPRPPSSSKAGAAHAIWYNSAFMPDECSSVGSNHVNTRGALAREKRSYSTSPAFLLSPSAECGEEEVRIREELAREVEEELERELMEGILVLVRRLSHLKAEQIARAINTAS